MLKDRQEKLSRREFYRFLGALAISREVDIGSETGEDRFDRAIKGVQGKVEGVSDLFSRMFDDEN